MPDHTIPPACKCCGQWLCDCDETIWTYAFMRADIDREPRFNDRGVGCYWSRPEAVEKQAASPNLKGPVQRCTEPMPPTLTRDAGPGQQEAVSVSPEERRPKPYICQSLTPAAGAGEKFMGRILRDQWPKHVFCYRAKGYIKAGQMVTLDDVFYVPQGTLETGSSRDLDTLASFVDTKRGSPSPNTLETDRDLRVRIRMAAEERGIFEPKDEPDFGPEAQRYEVKSLRLFIGGKELTEFKADATYEVGVDEAKGPDKSAAITAWEHPAYGPLATYKPGTDEDRGEVFKREYMCSWPEARWALCVRGAGDWTWFCCRDMRRYGYPGPEHRSNDAITFDSEREAIEFAQRGLPIALAWEVVPYGEYKSADEAVKLKHRNTVECTANPPPSTIPEILSATAIEAYRQHMEHVERLMMASISLPKCPDVSAIARRLNSMGPIDAAAMAHMVGVPLTDKEFDKAICGTAGGTHAPKLGPGETTTYPTEPNGYFYRAKQVTEAPCALKWCDRKWHAKQDPDTDRAGWNLCCSSNCLDTKRKLDATYKRLDDFRSRIWRGDHRARPPEPVMNEIAWAKERTDEEVDAIRQSWRALRHEPLQGNECVWPIVDDEE